MSFEDFPTEVDIIVLGTGLTSTVASAAFSRIGLKVLHLDRNDYYGGVFANFNLDQIEQWKSKNEKLVTLCNEDDFVAEEEAKVPKCPEDTKAIQLPRERASAVNISARYHVRNRTPEEAADVLSKKLPSGVKGIQLLCTHIALDMKDTTCPVPEVTDPPGKEETNDCFDGEGSEQEAASKSSAYIQKSLAVKENDSTENPQEDIKDKKELITDKPTCSTEASLTMSDTSNIDTGASTEKEGKDLLEKAPGNAEEKNASLPSSTSNSKDEAKGKKIWTVEAIKDEWRKFCFDVSPRVLFCCGDLIELLIRSDVARYCEFRTVSRVLTLLKDKLEQVPCSRADVFGSKIVSLIEKRLMMKFLQFAADYENHSQEYEGKENSLYIDFLKLMKLTPNLQHFVQHAIAMVPDSCITSEGLMKTKKFLTSLGRYGNTAFLFPLYGTGELSQAFSRMSAVFGGIFCLTETATHILSDSESNCCGIITSRGQVINCKYVVAESSYLPQNFVKRLSAGKVSRGIYITDSSISPSPDNDLTLLNFVCKDDRARPVTVMEIPSSAYVCPKDLYVVYLSRSSESDDPIEDLREVREKLFAPENISSAGSESSGDSDLPRILWSMHFTLNNWSQVSPTEQALGRLLPVSEGGDAELDLDFCVSEAKAIFLSVCPEEEFLPAPPNPEDIIHGEEEEKTDNEDKQGNNVDTDNSFEGSNQVINSSANCEENNIVNEAADSQELDVNTSSAAVANQKVGNERSRIDRDIGEKADNPHSTIDSADQNDDTVSTAGAETNLA